MLENFSNGASWAELAMARTPEQEEMIKSGFESLTQRWTEESENGENISIVDEIHDSIKEHQELLDLQPESKALVSFSSPDCTGIRELFGTPKPAVNVSYSGLREMIESAEESFDFMEEEDKEFTPIPVSLDCWIDENFPEPPAACEIVISQRKRGIIRRVKMFFATLFMCFSRKKYIEL